MLFLSKRSVLLAAVLGCMAVAVVVRKVFFRQPYLPDVPFADTNTATPPFTQYKTFQSAAANAPASYLIYLPPGYDTATGKRYPVVYWLHGLGGSQRSGEPFVAALDAAIRSGDAPPTIAVLVNGLVYRRYYDSKDGKWPVETVIVKDLIPHVDATYRTIATREGRAIEGFSMGGFGAVRYAFRYPELFAAVTSLAGPFYNENQIRGWRGASWTPDHFQKVFSGDAEYYRQTMPQTLASENPEAIRALQIRLIAGADDGQRRSGERFSKFLAGLNIPHEHRHIPGIDHNETHLYEAMGPGYFAFYKKLFATSTP